MRDLWQLWSGGASQAQIDWITNIANTKPVQEAGIFSSSEVDDKVRTSSIRWLTDEHKIRDWLFEYVKMANRNAFNLDVDNFADIQYTEYLATEGGHYDWHHDVDWNNDIGYDRKLSITLQLSSPDEYEGGDFEFSEVVSPGAETKEKGSVLVFPSYLQHRVKPVTKGKRISLVAWFEGPRWR
jgi:PKHD-type hydroxylase